MDAPLQRAHAEGGFSAVVPEDGPAGVEVGGVHTPQPAAGDVQLEHSCAIGLGAPGATGRAACPRRPPGPAGSAPRSRAGPPEAGPRKGLSGGQSVLRLSGSTKRSEGRDRKSVV